LTVASFRSQIRHEHVAVKKYRELCTAVVLQMVYECTPASLLSLMTPVFL
jgi:hypothetical protein